MECPKCDIEMIESKCGEKLCENCGFYYWNDKLETKYVEYKKMHEAIDLDEEVEF